jgi:glycosyltransferase involved in cell wall biosynthesis
MKILVIGNFGTAIQNYSGQTERTKAICDALEEIESLNINKLEIGILKTPLTLIKFFSCFIRQIYSSDTIVVIAAKNGISVFIKTFTFLRLQDKVIILPTGGWFNTDKFNVKNLNKFKAIVIQSERHFESVKKTLPDNAYHLPNFRKNYSINFILSKESQRVTFIPKVIFNSRITASKGIYELISAIQTINKPSIKFRLDIYGQITDVEYRNLKKFISKDIKYLGVYSPENVSVILDDYQILAFPTYYEGEGQPGVLLDALFNKLPIISTKWNFNDELVKHQFNGFLVKPKSTNDLIDCFLNYYEDPNLIAFHSQNSGILAQNFSFEKSVEKLKNIIW